MALAVVDPRGPHQLRRLLRSPRSPPSPHFDRASASFSPSHVHPRVRVDVCDPLAVRRDAPSSRWSRSSARLRRPRHALARSTLATPLRDGSERHVRDSLACGDSALEKGDLAASSRRCSYLASPDGLAIEKVAHVRERRPISSFCFSLRRRSCATRGRVREETSKGRSRADVDEPASTQPPPRRFLASSRLRSSLKASLPVIARPLPLPRTTVEHSTPWASSASSAVRPRRPPLDLEPD